MNRLDHVLAVEEGLHHGILSLGMTGKEVSKG
jgi:hypothetical protein